MMTVRTIWFFSTLAIFFVALIAAACFFYLRRRRARLYPYGQFEVLLGRIAAVNRGNVEAIARTLVDEFGQPLGNDDDVSDLAPEEIWQMIGGLEGLSDLERNTAVLVDLVFYVQQWHPEALAVAEQLRVNAREIQWHIDRLRAAVKRGPIETASAEAAQRAVAVYYTMTRHVLSLYEQLGIPGAGQLEHAL